MTQTAVSGVSNWLDALLGVSMPDEGNAVEIAGHAFLMRHGILRAQDLLSDRQQQTSDSFGYK